MITYKKTFLLLSLTSLYSLSLLASDQTAKTSGTEKSQGQTDGSTAQQEATAEELKAKISTLEKENEIVNKGYDILRSGTSWIIGENKRLLRLDTVLCFQHAFGMNKQLLPTLRQLSSSNITASNLNSAEKGESSPNMTSADASRMSDIDEMNALLPTVERQTDTFARVDGKVYRGYEVWTTNENQTKTLLMAYLRPATETDPANLLEEENKKQSELIQLLKQATDIRDINIQLLEQQTQQFQAKISCQENMLRIFQGRVYKYPSDMFQCKTHIVPVIEYLATKACTNNLAHNPNATETTQTGNNYAEKSLPELQDMLVKLLEPVQKEAGITVVVQAGKDENYPEQKDKVLQVVKAQFKKDGPWQYYLHHRIDQKPSDVLRDPIDQKPSDVLRDPEEIANLNKKIESLERQIDRKDFEITHLEGMVDRANARVRGLQSVVDATNPVSQPLHNLVLLEQDKKVLEKDKKNLQEENKKLNEKLASLSGQLTQKNSDAINNIRQSPLLYAAQVYGERFKEFAKKTQKTISDHKYAFGGAAALTTLTAAYVGYAAWSWNKGNNFIGHSVMNPCFDKAAETINTGLNTLGKKIAETSFVARHLQQPTVPAVTSPKISLKSFLTY